MKLSISNIAWSAEHDPHMFALLRKLGIEGLEIAPTRVFPTQPYDQVEAARDFANSLRAGFGLRVCSMQSLWFGRTELVFGTPAERESLVDYTRKAIDFAAAMGCQNLVFGNPRNRRQETPDLLNRDGLDFFRSLADYAGARKTVIALEPNPPMYGTNFVNTTEEAFQLVRHLDHPGLRVNFDLGAVIANGESLESLAENLHLVSHVHISEPGLEVVKPREEHRDLAGILVQGDYQGYVSIEMKNCQNLEPVEAALMHLKEVFA